MSFAGSQQEEVAEHTRWNFAVIVSEAAFFMAGLAWVEPSAVLPLFISHLGGSTVIVGLIAVMLQLGFKVPQVFMAAVIGHRPNRLPYLRWPILLGVIPLLAFVVYLWLAGVGNAVTVLWFLAIAYCCLFLGNGFLGLPWYDIVAKSIPPGLRGRFFGTMQFVSAITAFAVGFAVRYALGAAGPGYPRNYILLFTAMGLFMCLSTIGCWMIREPIRPVLARPQSLAEILRSALPMLRNHSAFRSLTITALFAFAVMGATPFYIVYAKQHLGIRDEAAGMYIWAWTIGGAIASLLWGHLNDSRGPRAVVRGTSVLLCLTPLLALALPASVLWLGQTFPCLISALPYLYGLVFLCAGASVNAIWFGATNYLFELAGHEHRPRYIAVFQLCTIPSSLSALALGWLLNHAPFALMFALAATCGAAALVSSLRMPIPTTGDALPAADG